MSEIIKFCEHCGHPLDPGARFCEGCGQAVQAGPAPAPPPPPTPPVAAPAPPLPAGVQPTKSIIPWLMGGLALIAILGVVGGYYWDRTSRGPTLPSQGQVQPPGPPVVPETPGSGRQVSPPSIPIQPPELPPPAPSGLSWPWTSQRPVTMADLEGLSSQEAELMRNEIFARRGWVFQRPELRAFFEQQPWYRPRGSLANREAVNRQVEKLLTPLERHNVKAIVEYENMLRRLP